MRPKLQPIALFRQRQGRLQPVAQEGRAGRRQLVRQRLLLGAPIAGEIAGPAFGDPALIGAHRGDPRRDRGAAEQFAGHLRDLQHIVARLVADLGQLQRRQRAVLIDHAQRGIGIRQAGNAEPADQAKRQQRHHACRRHPPGDPGRRIGQPPPPFRPHDLALA
jgi:hypothetical protein